MRVHRIGAKTLDGEDDCIQSDGRTFYYSDYHSAARKSYFPDTWPCCSGTLPQVAAHYRILAYFRTPQAFV